MEQGRESLGKNLKINLMFLRVGADPRPQKIPGRDARLGMGVVSPKVAENGQSRAWAPHSQLSARFLGFCAPFC